MLRFSTYRRQGLSTQSIPILGKVDDPRSTYGRFRFQFEKVPSQDPKVLRAFEGDPNKSEKDCCRYIVVWVGWAERALLGAGLPNQTEIQNGIGKGWWVGQIKLSSNRRGWFNCFNCCDDVNITTTTTSWEFHARL